MLNDQSTNSTPNYNQASDGSNFSAKKIGVALGLLLSGVAIGGALVYFLVPNLIQQKNKPVSANESAKIPNGTSTEATILPTGEISSELPKDDPYTKDWLVFTSSDNTYSFKYPKSWALSTEMVENNALGPSDKRLYQNVTLSKGSKEVVKFSYVFVSGRLGCYAYIDNDIIVNRSYYFGDNFVRMEEVSCKGTSFEAIFKNPTIYPEGYKSNYPGTLFLTYSLDYSNRDENFKTEEDFYHFAKSISGLTPKNSF